MRTSVGTHTYTKYTIKFSLFCLVVVVAAPKNGVCRRFAFSAGCVMSGRVPRQFLSFVEYSPKYENCITTCNFVRSHARIFCICLQRRNTDKYDHENNNRKLQNASTTLATAAAASTASSVNRKLVFCLSQPNAKTSRELLVSVFVSHLFVSFCA